ncbi:MAG: CDP-alcohol phosphatidyltransferase family protein [Victivallaceae bacterium]
MLNYCNFVSISRLGFTLLFFQSNPLLRLVAVSGAVISDFLDGYLARKFLLTTQFGAVLDPLMDKLFVGTSVMILCMEGALSYKELLMVLSRDVFLSLFGLYLTLVRAWRGYDYKAMFWGKVFTVAQFSVLIAVTSSVKLSFFYFYSFIGLGILAFVERVADYRKKRLSCSDNLGQ